MTETTRVPLQPIAKGSMLKLWSAVALLIAAGIALAWCNRYDGVVVSTLKSPPAQVAGQPGSQPGNPGPTDVVLVNYVGKLANGKEFDKGQQQPIPLEVTVPGFIEGLQKMEQGGKYRLKIPARLGYGAEEKKNPQTGEVVIPANSDLVFDIELLGFIPREQYQQMMQMQQMQGGGPGGPAGGPGDAPQGPPSGQPGR